MRWKISVLLIAAMLCLTFTGVAAAGDIKCTWEPCGTKVVQNDTEAVYVLNKDCQIRIMYGDVNSNGEYDTGETVYVDMVDNGQDKVEAGDVRLTWYHDMYAPNTKVNSTNIDKNNPLVEFDCGQMVVGFVDVNNDGVYDLGDPLYVDTDCDSKVSVGDVRLTERNVNIQTYPPYSVVASSDWDVNGDLLDTVTYNTVITTDFWKLVGYIDSDCSGDWTCPDKLYLQQITDTVADDFVTIGDMRLYIPPEAITSEGWPECGTKVKQSDVDAVYVLTMDDQVRIMFGDVNSNGEYDIGETVYVDMFDNGQDKVEAGDVRLTWYHDMYAPNTKVNSTNIDKNNPLVEFDCGQMVVGFVDVNNDGVYDKYDPLYVDTDCDSRVSVGDVRLTERTAMGTLYLAYSVVENGDFDGILNEDLLDTVTYNTVITTDFWELVGYIDSDCSGDWTCPDKLYLQQITGTLADQLVTIGDFRLYIPPEAIIEGWPKCGTKVQQCNKDAVYVLTMDDQIRIMYGDVNSNGEYDIGETVYVDMVDNGQDKVEAGDVRLTWYHDMYAPNTKVNSTNIDKNNPLVEFDCYQKVVGFVDVNNDGVYDLGDPLYVDTDCDSKVSVGDVRLTKRMDYAPYTVVEAGHWDLMGDTDLLDPLTYHTVITTEFWELVGYIDSDCSGDWTCPDKLYLQQLIWQQNWGFEMGDLTNWDVIAGNVEVLQATNFAPTIPVPKGQFYALLSTGPGQVVPGSSPENRDGTLGNENDIAILQREFRAFCPTELTIQLDFLTGEENQALMFDDIFEVTLDGVPIVQGSVDQFGLLSSLWPNYGPYDQTTYTVFSPGLTGGSVFGIAPNGGRTGFTPYVVPVDPGQHVIEFYIGDQGNHSVDSGLLIDITAAPATADKVVTIGDLRLYMPPCEVTNGEEPIDDTYNPYDENENNVIEIGEMMAAIGDWKAGNLEIGEMMEVIGYWKAGSYSL